MAHMLSGAPLAERPLHAVVQHGAVGQPGQRIEAGQMIDLGLGDLSLGDVLHQDDHAAVFHRLQGEFERAPAFTCPVERGIVAAGKPGVELLDQALSRWLR